MMAISPRKDRSHSGEEQPAEADTQETTPQSAEPPKSEPAAKVSEDEQLVMEELDQAQPPAEASADETPKDQTTSPSEANDPYSHFPLPQRTLIHGLQTANKPFDFVGDGVRDILGLVGIITVIMSIIGAALILLLR